MRVNVNVLGGAVSAAASEAIFEEQQCTKLKTKTTMHDVCVGERERVGWDRAGGITVIYAVWIRENMEPCRPDKLFPNY